MILSRQLTLDLTTPPAHSRGDFLPAAANAAALSTLDQPQVWPSGRMLLIGPEGAGKTHLAAFWAAENGARRMSAASLRPDAADLLVAEGGALVIEDADHAGFAALSPPTAKAGTSAPRSSPRSGFDAFPSSARRFTP